MDDKVYVTPPERIGHPEPDEAPTPVISTVFTAPTPETVVLTPHNAVADSDEPQSLDDIIAGLKGFGLEENEEIITFVASGKTLRVRIANIPTEQEMEALIAVEGYKGYTWIQRVRCEILSRAITWIEGTSIRDLTPLQRLVVDPTTGKKADIQLALRNILMGWGQELLGVLWKILMVHSDKIEKRLKSSFPESDLTTDIERRFFEAALKEVEDTTKEVLTDTVAEALAGEFDDDEKKEFKQILREGMKQ